MKNYSFAFLHLAVVLIFILVEFSSAAETTDPPLKKEKTCKAIIADITKRQLTGISNCSKAMTFKNGKEKAAKMNCILKCVMVNEGLLVHPGLATDEGFEAFMNKEIPEKMLETAGPLFLNCKNAHGPGLDPSEKDEFCKTYDPFLKCLLGVMGKMCPPPSKPK